MPWVIGAVVAYVGYKYWESGKNQNAINNFFEVEQSISQAKYPEGGTGYTQYAYPSNVIQ
jgi:hypothetical protein